MPKLPGMIKGLGVTFGEMVKTLKDGPVTTQYPHEKERRRPRPGVIALHEENCTACMLCARECPDWCIYIEGHKYLAPPRREGGKPRQKNGSTASTSTSRSACTAASASRSARSRRCSGAPSTSSPRSRSPTCSTTRTASAHWMQTVPDFEPYEGGAEVKVKKVPED